MFSSFGGIMQDKRFEIPLRQKIATTEAQSKPGVLKRPPLLFTNESKSFISSIDLLNDHSSNLRENLMPKQRTTDSHSQSQITSELRQVSILYQLLLIRFCFTACTNTRRYSTPIEFLQLECLRKNRRIGHNIFPTRQF